MKKYLYSGQCHCGNVVVELSTLISPKNTLIRACKCSFCRKQKGQYISDSEATLNINIWEPEQLSNT